ncbi:MAG: hypothetical protein ABFD79_06490 [Phycisphaerales bacterium]
MTLLYEYLKKIGWRVPGWNIDNPPEIETAFRQGFLWAAKESIKMPFCEIKLQCLKLSLNRGNSSLQPIWEDPKEAELRGRSYGIWYVYQHLNTGGTRESCLPWLKAVEKWANENPLRMESRYAFPPGI